MEKIPRNLQPFDMAKVPSEVDVAVAKIMKLFFYGLLIVVPVVGLLFAIPFIQTLEGASFYSAVILIPFLLFLMTVALFAYANKQYGVVLQRYAAYKSLKPVINLLPEKPKSVFIAIPSLGETLVTGIGIKEFAMEFPSHPNKMVYYYDGTVCAGLSAYVSPSPFYGLRIRVAAPLKRGKPGRYERFGAIYLPAWGFTGETLDLQHLRRRVDVSGLDLVEDEPEPSRIEFALDEAIVVLSLRKGKYSLVGRAIEKALELESMLKEEGVIE